MFGLFQNNTPHYAGDGQPSAYKGNRGGLGLLVGLFGSSTPKYATARSDNAQATATVISPATTEFDGASDQLPAQPDCRVPLPCAIVIQRSEA